MFASCLLPCIYLRLVKAVKYSETNCEYTLEKLLAASVCPISNCPNWQSTVDVARESTDDASSPSEDTSGTSVTETLGLFPQVGRAASAVWVSSETWFLLVLPSSFSLTAD